MKEGTPGISVLTTVFNREKYLDACIRSVIASTFTDWELIIVDDCSTDNSVAIAQQYAAQDARIKVVVNDENLGDYPNRNKAASLARGKYLKYLDADDMVYPFGLQVFFETMEMFPDAALGISQEVKEDYLPYPFQLAPEEVYRRQFIQKGVLDLGPTGTIIKRKVFEELNGFSGMRYVGDTEMWMKIAARYPVVKMQPGLAYWRRHEDQEINSGYSNDFYNIMDYRIRLQALQDDACPFRDTNEKTRAVLWLRFRHGRLIWHIFFKTLAFGRAWQIKKKSGRKCYDVLISALPWKLYIKLAEKS